jgi:hypothetical protein
MTTREAKAAYQRQWRASHGAVTGAVGAPVRQPCGTVAGYRRHRKAGEDACQPCKDANAEKARNRRRGA